MVARCFQGMALQVVKRMVMVASTWRWVADGGAMFLGNAIASFHGGTVFLGNVIAGGQTQCDGDFQVALGCRWWRHVFLGNCTQRDANRFVMVASRWKSEES